MTDLYVQWKAGTADARWYCVDCWHQHLDNENIWDTRNQIGLQRKRELRTPQCVRDGRFNRRENRWSLCDWCGKCCKGRDRYNLHGSFVYNKENAKGGPPQVRQGCFPASPFQKEWWSEG